MKKLNTVAVLFAAVALGGCATSGGSASGVIDNWRAADGIAVKNGTNELCWRDANWTPATALAGCDGAPAPAPAPA
ncbi:MAG TPA: OmpA family protein, partial [Methylibium sp.]|nr:OmpA family protein [Methylibium sp.]